MKLGFNCRPLSASPLARPLVFTWNPDTGEVEGPDAERVLQLAGSTWVGAHPQPWAWRLGAEPLKSWTDMAAIVGSEWHLPPELREYYPRCPPHEPPRDEAGETLPGFCYEPRRPAAGK